MAQAAPQFEEENKPGNVDSAPPGRAQLKGLEGSGETSEPNRSWYKPQGSDQDTASSDEAAGLAQAGQPEHENQVGAGYTKSDLKNVVPMSRGEKLSSRLWVFNRRRALVGGGVIGTIIAILFFFISSGPLEFVHIAQLMEQFHFSAQQDQTDDRFTKLARYIRYSSSGKVQNSRLGKVQNKIADRIEGKLNATGIESAYSEKFGLLDGYVIDPEKLSTSDFEDLKGKTPREIESYFKDTFNVDITPRGNGTFFVNAKNLGYFQNGKLTRTMVKASGYSKITSASAARIMGKRAGISWHPISIAEGKGLRLAEEKLQARKDRVKSIEEGTTDTITADNQSNPNDQNNHQSAQDVTDSANGTIADGQQANTDLQNGSTSAFDNIKAGLNNKLTVGGLAATGVLCILKGLDSQAGQIKEAQVVLPLVREGGEAMAVGNQTMSGRDIDTTHLGFYKDYLNGKDHTGANSSWIQADSIQAELGHANTGTPPIKTLTTINAGSPFSSLNQEPIGSALGVACSPFGVGLQIAIGFLTGGVASNIIQLAAGPILAAPILDEAAHWIAGAAIDPNAAGADYGSAINYGSRLAANAQAVSQGGRKLSDSEANQLTAFENNQLQQEFQNHSLAYKLLNPYDERSAISKVIDSTSPDVGQDFAKMGSIFTNFGHLFTSVPKLFSATAHAAPAPYNYGFPKYGFSKAEMNDPALENPYANADYVVNTILPAHHEYIQWAKDCFGVTVDPTTYDISDFGATAIDPANPDPNVQNFYTNHQNKCDNPPEPNSYTAPTSDCSNSTSPACNAHRVRYYIYDTENATSMQCFIGGNNDSDTQQACSDIGFDESQTSAPTTGIGTLPTGSAQQIAQQLLPYIQNGKISCNRQASNCPDIQNTANGKSIGGNCQASALDSNLVGMMLVLVQMGHTFVLSALCSDHSTGSPHTLGKAADFNYIDGVFMGPNDVGWDSSKINVGQKFDDDVASFMPKGITGFGQINCHPAFPFQASWPQINLFPDSCHHQHIDVAR